MKLELVKQSVRDFRTFVGWHHLDYSKIERGFHFVRGRNDATRDEQESNGAGKSTFFSDAPAWCWFGHTLENLRGPDVRPWKRETGNPVVITYITIDGKPHKVKRTHSPNLLTFDDKEIGQSELEERLGISDKVFPHTMVMGQGMPLFFDLERRKKMEVFASALLLDRWERWSGNAKKAADDYEKQRAACDVELSGLDHQLTELEELKAEAERSSQAWQAEQEQRENNAKRELKELRKRLVVEQQKADEANLALDGSLMELRPLQEQLRTIGDEYNRLQAVFQGEVAAEEEALRSLRAELREVEEAGTARNCPTCGQPLRDADARKKHIQALRKRLRKLEDQPLLPPPKKLGKLQGTIARLRMIADDLQRKADDAQASYNLHLPEVRALKTKESALVAQTSSDRDTSNPHRLTIKSLRERIEAIKDKQEEAKKDQAWLERAIARHRFWVKGFKDVRLYIVDEVLQELQVTTNSILGDIGLGDWEIKYAIEKETKSGTIQSGLDVMVLGPDNRKAVKWECWSGGERQRLRLVGALALSEVLLGHSGLKVGWQVLDEPSQHLSTSGVRNLGYLLEDWASLTRRSIFYVDHTVVESARFASTITIARDREGSYIDERRPKGKKIERAA